MKIEISWSKGFQRTFKKWIKKHPDLKETFYEKLEQFQVDPQHPSLNAHNLDGKFSGSRSLSIKYEHRLIFKIIKNKAILINTGTHDEVYG